MVKTTGYGLFKRVGFNRSTIRLLMAKLGVGGWSVSLKSDQVDQFSKNWLLDRVLFTYYRSSIEVRRRSGSRAGLRHRQKLPVRGQRTHSNSSTARRIVVKLLLVYGLVQEG